MKDGTLKLRTLLLMASVVYTCLYHLADLRGVVDVSGLDHRSPKGRDVGNRRRVSVSRNRDPPDTTTSVPPQGNQETGVVRLVHTIFKRARNTRKKK